LLAEKLKREFIELLEKDVEFRYTVAGYIGLSEILKRLDRLEEAQRILLEGQQKLWEAQNKLWDEIRALREEQNKLWGAHNKLWEEVRNLREEQNRLWEGQNRLWEGQNRLWEEVKALREGQNRLWEGQNRLWEEVKVLREGQNRLWEEVKALREGQNKLWDEVRDLREGQNRLWEEVKALREGQTRLWEEVRALREGENRLWDAHNRLWEEVRNLREGQDRLRKYMVSGFRGLSRALGVTFEDHAASFLEVMLVEMGYPDARVEKKYLVYGGEVLELNMFCEEPLVVGEATVSVEDAEAEVEKVLRRARAVEERYGRKPTLTLLCAATCRADAAERLKELCEKHGIKLILGKEIA
jgi:uncharacterized coiled-coil DUF342 family protein